MKSNNRNWMLILLVYACAIILPANHALAASYGEVRRLSNGEGAKVSGLISSCDGDLIRIRDKKSSELAVMRIDDNTNIERTKYKFPCRRHVDMDVTTFNMNVNEVISNVCSILGGTPVGSKQPVHLNGHVNMSQSSNDTFPNAMYITAALNTWEHLIPAVRASHDPIASKVQL